MSAQPQAASPEEPTSPLSTSACWGCLAVQLHLQTHTYVFGLPNSQMQAVWVLWTSMHVLDRHHAWALKLMQGGPDQVGDAHLGHRVIHRSCRTLGSGQEGSLLAQRRAYLCYG